MKKSLALLLFFILNTAAASSFVDDTFRDLYNDKNIQGALCGRNINYFLNELKYRDLGFNRGYVVSIHDPAGTINQFDARWGKTEKYSDGETYSRSNWYFHVFAVIDGKVYDFSQEGPKTQSLRAYIEDSYLPKKETQQIFLQGRLTPESQYKKTFNLRMKIYNIHDYILNYGPPVYEGDFIELFKLTRNERFEINTSNVPRGALKFQDMKRERNGAVTFINPAIQDKGQIVPFKADAYEICRMYGYNGGVPSATLHHVTDKVHMYQVESQLIPSNGSVVNMSYRLVSKETDGNVPNKPVFHMAHSVTCSDLRQALNSL